MSEHRTFTCCHEGCGQVICFDPGVEERLRRTHEWWYCPAGHSQHFSGKTEQEKTIERLRRQHAWAEERADMWRTRPTRLAAPATGPPAVSSPRPAVG